MIKAKDILDLLPEKNYDLMVQAMDKVSASKLPKGYDEVVSLIAQTLNGGFEQYISNGYLNELDTAISFLKGLGQYGKQASEVLMKLKVDAKAFADVLKKDYSEDEYEELADELEIWDEWLYAQDRDEHIAAEMVQYLKDKKIMEATIGGRQLASSSDKSKYASIKKQIADIGTQKKSLHDIISKEADDAKRADAQKKLHALRDKEMGLDKIRKEMLSKYRGLRSSN